MAEPTPPFLAKSLVKFKSRHPETDLSFAKDEIVRVIAEEDEDWWAGESEDGSRKGIFPKNFVEAMPEPEEDEADGMPLPPRPKAKAPKNLPQAAPPLPTSPAQSESRATPLTEHGKRSFEQDALSSDKPGRSADIGGDVAPTLGNAQAEVSDTRTEADPQGISQERPPEMPPTPAHQPAEEMSVPTVPSNAQLREGSDLPSVVKKPDDVAVTERHEERPMRATQSETKEGVNSAKASRAATKPTVDLAHEDSQNKSFGSASMNPADAKETIGKGGSLRDRMKMFQAQQSQDQAKSAGPPAPKPKPQFKKWEAPPPPPPAPAQSEASQTSPTRKTSIEQPLQAGSAPPIPAQDTSSKPMSSMSREDAKSSISTGGSLKERIAMIQAQQEAQRLAAEGGGDQSQDRSGDQPTVGWHQHADDPEAGETQDDVGTNPAVKSEPPIQGSEDDDRRTKLAQRMAALGGRSMGMNPFGPPPPIPKKIQTHNEPRPSEQSIETPPLTQENVKTVAMPAIPRRAGPPPRRKPTTSSAGTNDSGTLLSTDTTGPQMTDEGRNSHVHFDPETDAPAFEAPREAAVEFQDDEEADTADKSPPESDTRAGAELHDAHQTAVSVADATMEGEEDVDVDEITASYANSSDGLPEEVEKPVDQEPATSSRPKGIPPGAFNLFGGSQPRLPQMSTPSRRSTSEVKSGTSEEADQSQKSTPRRPLPTPPPVSMSSPRSALSSHQDIPLDEVARKRLSEGRRDEPSQDPTEEDGEEGDDDSAEYAPPTSDQGSEEAYSDEEQDLSSRFSMMSSPSTATTRAPPPRPDTQDQRPPPPLPNQRPSVELARTDRPSIPSGRPPIPSQSSPGRKSMEVPSRRSQQSYESAPMEEYSQIDSDDYDATDVLPAQRSPAPLPASRPPPQMPRSSPQEERPNTAMSRPSMESKRSASSFSKSPRASQEVFSPQSRSLQRQVSDPRGSGSSGLAGMYKARDIDLAPQTRWWRLQPVALPFALASRCDASNPARDAIFRSKREQIEKGREQLQLTILYDDYSSSVLSVQYDKSDQDVNVGQRHQPPPPIDGADHLAYVSNQVGQRLHANAKAALGKLVGEGDSSSFIHQVLRSTGGLLEPVGNTYGVTVLSLPTASMEAKNRLLDEPRPGDVLVLSHARFSGRKGLSNYTQSAGDGLEPAVGVVSEYEGRKGKEGKLRVLIQKPGVGVELASFRLADLKSGTLKVYRVMMDTWVHHWSSLSYI